MIAVPHVTKPSPVAAMNCPEEWPSLGGALSHVEDATQTSHNCAAATIGDDWEMLSPVEVGHLDDGVEEMSIVIPRSLQVTRKNSFSAPELRELGESAPTASVEEDYSMLDAQSESVFIVPAAEGSVASSGIMVPTREANRWLNKNKVSFRDAILTPSKYVPAQKMKYGVAAEQLTKNRVKSRYVVTPIKRCAKSTGDLLALIDEDDEEVLGESDAMEYYQRKAHGAHGHFNGMKQRPDEAKRKVLIVQKKNMQREKQAT